MKHEITGFLAGTVASVFLLVLGFHPLLVVLCYAVTTFIVKILTRDDREVSGRKVNNRQAPVRPGRGVYGWENSSAYPAASPVEGLVLGVPLRTSNSYFLHPEPRKVS